MTRKMQAVDLDVLTMLQDQPPVHDPWPEARILAVVLDGFGSPVGFDAEVLGAERHGHERAGLAAQHDRAPGSAGSMAEAQGFAVFARGEHHLVAGPNVREPSIGIGRRAQISGIDHDPQPEMRVDNLPDTFQS